jgi:hypothetical protein
LKINDIYTTKLCIMLDIVFVCAFCDRNIVKSPKWNSKLKRDSKI